MPPTNGKLKSRAKSEEDEFTPEVPTKVRGPGRKSKKQKVEEDICEKPAPGVEEGIEVKTKFPVARIKRIMQADEDVGKVAQVTPTAVCQFAYFLPPPPPRQTHHTDSFHLIAKALELFMISVVTKAANEARAKQSKRVTAAHLKQAVMKDDQLDFLAEIIAKVPDAPAPAKKEKEEDSEEAGEGKRKKKGGTKKKKKDDDDDF